MQKVNSLGRRMMNSIIGKGKLPLSLSIKETSQR
jgi:hypothetical protein